MSNKPAQRQRQTSTHYHDAARHEQEAAHLSEAGNYEQAAADQRRPAVRDADKAAKQRSTAKAPRRK